MDGGWSPCKGQDSFGRNIDQNDFRASHRFPLTGEEKANIPAAPPAWGHPNRQISIMSTSLPSNAIQVTGPVGESLRGPCFVGLELSPREMPMVLAGVARLLVGERVIYCADGCNRFDPYRFSHWARRCGLDPGEVLSRVFLSRAFTIHQLTALAVEEFPRLARGAQPPLLVLLGMEELFLDEQIPRFEREHHFARTLRALEGLRRRGGSLLATVGGGEDPDRRQRALPWIRRLGQSAEIMARLRSMAGGNLVFERMGRHPAPALCGEPTSPPEPVVETDARVLL